MAHKKGVGSTKNGRDSESKRCLLYTSYVLMADSGVEPRREAQAEAAILKELNDLCTGSRPFPVR